MTEESLTVNLNNFIAQIILPNPHSETKSSSKPSSATCSKSSNIAQNVEEQQQIEEEQNTSTTNTEDIKPHDTPRERSFNMVKTHLASLETDFVEYQQHVSIKFEKTFELITNKDKEIETLKEKLVKSESNQHNMQQSISDMTLTLLEQQEEIGKLKILVEKTHDELSQLKNKIVNYPLHDI
jgi:chromosome segregation ATPase